MVELSPGSRVFVYQTSVDVTSKKASQIYRQMYGKLEKLTGHLPAKLHLFNLVNTIFYLQYCAKVMQTIIDKYQEYRDIMAIFNEILP